MRKRQKTTPIYLLFALLPMLAVGQNTVRAGHSLVNDSISLKKVVIDSFSKDIGFGSASHRELPTQLSVKTYTDTHLGTRPLSTAPPSTGDVVKWNGTTWQPATDDGGTDTDDQRLDTFDIVSNILRASLTDDAQPFRSVNLAPYLDNTDNQGADIFDVSGGNLRLSLDNNATVHTVPVTSIAPDQSSTNEAWTVDADDADTEVISNQTVKFQGAGINTTDYNPATDVLLITATEVDGSVTNEGSLTVAAGAGNTSIINSNTSGQTGVTLTAGTNMTISEAGNVITLNSTGVSKWTDVGAGNIYRNSSVKIGAATDPTLGKLVVEGMTGGATILAGGGALTSGDAMFKATGNLTSGFAYALFGDISVTGGNVIQRIRNGATTNAGSNTIQQIGVANSVVGDPMTQYQVEGATTLVMGIDNSNADKAKIGFATSPSGVGNAGITITTDATSLIGINRDVPLYPLDVDGKVRATQGFATSNTPPSVSFGASAGTGATTGTYVGGASAFNWTFTTGTSPTASGVIATFTPVTAAPNGNILVCQHGNANAAADWAKFLATLAGTTACRLSANGTLPASTTYTLSCHIIQY